MSEASRAERAKVASRWAAVGLGLVMAWTAGCGPGGGGPPPEPVIDVAVASPAVMTVEDIVPAVGNIEPDERVVLQPEVPGLIESIHFEEGQRVRKGDVLFRMRSRKEEAQLAQARADQGLAQANLERARTLAGSKAISQQELDLMESTLAARAATLELETRRLEERVVMAPFDGVVGRREVSVGQYVNAGMPLVVLVEDARVKVEFRLPERLLASVKTGLPGRIGVAAYPGRTFAGQVDLVDPEVEPASRTIAARLRVPNPEGLLRPGMFARVELVTGTRAGALVVPESALVPSLDDFAVYVMDAERAKYRPVKIGVRLPGRVELKEGVAREAVVIVSGTQKIVDGTRVKAQADPSLAAAGTNAVAKGEGAGPGARTAEDAKP